MPAWTQDVDMHFAAFVRAWTEAGSQAMNRTAALPRQSFLTADTMHLVDIRKALRTYLRQEERALNQLRLMFGFAGFVLHSQQRSAAASARARARHSLHALNVSIARAWSMLNHTCRLLREAVKRDRNRYLQQLVQEVGLADLSCPKQLYRKVRRAIPKAAAARRSGFVALPAVELLDGSLATSGEAKEQRWREHFAEQESGTPVTKDEYSALVLRSDGDRAAGSFVFDPRLLPSMLSIETAIHGLSRSKAAGPDGITAELLKLSPTQAARHLVGLHLKCVLAVREPVEYKGGALMTLAKKAGASFSCGRFRSILLSSVAGKLFHRDLRDKLTPALEAMCHDLHGGVRPGIGVDTISLTVKCFQTATKHAGLLPALVFYDVRAAYYQVLRECLTGAELDDAILLRLFTRLGVPAAAFTELKSQLARIAILSESGCTPHTVAMMREVFVGTWFRLDHSVPLVSTAAGVRPGDPLADVLFALSFSAYTKVVQDALEHAGLGTPVPAPAKAPPWTDEVADGYLGPASWADDFVAMHSAPTPVELISQVCQATSLYLTHATANGIELAFAVDKTAVVLPPSASFDAAIHAGTADAPPHLMIADAITGQQKQLPIVQAYKHLGGIITSTHTVVPEIHYRHAQATWTLRPLRGVLFGNPSVPLQTRRQLLQSLVFAKFTFGSATIGLHVAGHFRLWARLYVSVFRALQPRTALCHKLHSFAILRHAQASTPTLALAKARAGFLARLFRHGPATLRRLLWLQWEARPAHSWFGQLLDDLRHVVLYRPGVQVVLQAVCPVTALLESYQSDPTWWKRQIQAAIKLCARRS